MIFTIGGEPLLEGFLFHHNRLGQPVLRRPPVGM